MVALAGLVVVVVTMGMETVILSVQLAVVVVDHEGVGGEDWGEEEEELGERVMVTVPLAEAAPARARVSRWDGSIIGGISLSWWD